MDIMANVSIFLFVGGIVVLFVSLTNREMITGLWVVGDIKRDQDFIDKGRFLKRVYLILRIVGILMIIAGLIMMTLVKK
jgi:hypothetical protein